MSTPRKPTAMSTVDLKSLTGKSAETHLLFLANHGLKNFPINFKLSSQLGATDADLTITGKQLRIVVGSTVKFLSNGDYTDYTLLIPSGTAKGSLFIDKNAAPDPTVKLIIKQYPSYFGESGRIVVEFWNANGDIVAVFKSNEGDFYAAGSATYNG